MMAEPPSREQFPVVITKGHASVKPYRVRKRGKDHYCVTYRSTEGRQRRMFSNLEVARREANNAAHTLSIGDLHALKLTGTEREFYVAAR